MRPLGAKQNMLEFNMNIVFLEYIYFLTMPKRSQTPMVFEKTESFTLPGGQDVATQVGM